MHDISFIDIYVTEIYIRGLSKHKNTEFFSIVGILQGWVAAEFYLFVYEIINQKVLYIKKVFKYFLHRCNLVIDS